MKTLYLECQMGAAGDMLMAALLELLPDPAPFLARMNALGIPGVEITREPMQKCGITGTHIRVRVRGEEEQSEDVGGHAHPHAQEAPHVHEHPHEHDHGEAPHDRGYLHEHEHGGETPHTHEHGHEHGEGHSHPHGHHHYSFSDIRALIEGFDLPAEVRSDAIAVYRLIAEAESHAHGVAAEEVHFHEVGSMDAVADIVGCCLLFHLIGADRVAASPVHVGSGFVRCAHGVLPVPAPATAYLLRGVPAYGGEVRGELCTPPGAALLRPFVSSFGPMPVMAAEKIGYGMGSKEFECANCLRAFLGEEDGGMDETCELRCNLDDMTPEAVGAAVDLLFAAGALDVFLTPIQMKKNRPGVMLTCLARPAQKQAVVEAMLLHTSTLGVREHTCRRTVLRSSLSTVDTPYGPICVKRSSGHGVAKEKPEYADVLAAAKAHGVPFETVWRYAVAACESEA